MSEPKISSSYLTQLGSGFDANGVDGPQLGKAETEKVTTEQIWGHDKRDAIGRAASIQRRKLVVARKLRRLAAEVEALEAMDTEMDSNYQEAMEDNLGGYGRTKQSTKRHAYQDIIDVIDDEASGCAVSECADEPEDLSSSSSSSSSSSPSSSFTKTISARRKKADHPLVHTDGQGTKLDDPGAFEDAQTGDNDWVNIGEAKPNATDRDEIGRPNLHK